MDLEAKLARLDALQQEQAKLANELTTAYAADKKRQAEEAAKLLTRQQTLEEGKRRMDRLQANFSRVASPDSVYPQDTYNTFQFTNGSLARNVFNRDGNVINGEYRFYARTLAGLNTQGNAAYQPGTTTPINGNGNGTSAPGNSTGVGGTQQEPNEDSILKQKGWAGGTLQLAVITRIAGLVSGESSDPLLSYRLYQTYKIAVVAGAAALQRLPDGTYNVWAVQNVKYKNLNPVSFEISDPTWFLTGQIDNIPDDDQNKTISADDPNFTLLFWDVDHYNVWFYTVFGTLDLIDLEFEFLSRGFFQRPLLFQLKSSGNTNAKDELTAITNPGTRVIPIETARVEDADNLINESAGHVVVGNRYAYVELGSPQDTQIFETFPKLGQNFWESTLGLTPQVAKFDASRSITDEVAPQLDMNRVLAYKYKLPVAAFVDEINKRGNLDVNAVGIIDEPTPNVGGKEEGNDPEADAKPDDRQPDER